MIIEWGAISKPVGNFANYGGMCERRATLPKIPWRGAQLPSRRLSWKESGSFVARNSPYPKWRPKFPPAIRATASFHISPLSPFFSRFDSLPTIPPQEGVQGRWRGRLPPQAGSRPYRRKGRLLRRAACVTPGAAEESPTRVYPPPSPVFFSWRRSSDQALRRS